ncbi:MAG: hypothetical protein ACREBU_01800 [Nitrososphaera sp.]
MTGKKKNSHIFARAGNDWHVEPQWVSDALFRSEPFDGPIWDPACGQGNVLEAARRAGHAVIGHDIVERSNAYGVADFFSAGLSEMSHAANIVTNPPFGRGAAAESFIRHALALKPRKLAVFVNCRFLFGAKRNSSLFLKIRPARVRLLVPRPSCPPGEFLPAGNKAGGGEADYCWIIWEFPHLNPSTAISWLQKYGTP